MPVVRVDDEVWNWLKSHATPFEDTPNSVLRRLAKLDVTVHGATNVGRGNSTNNARQKHVAILPKSGNSGNDAYVVTKRPDKHKHWWFQIYQRKLVQKARHGDFSIVVVCDRKAPSESVFHVPYSYLRDQILPNAKLESDKRYMFEVRKDSFEFVFHPGISFDGRKFLIRTAP